MEKSLLTIKEACIYTGIGDTHMRKMANSPRSTFTIRNGKKILIHKESLDKYLEKCAKFHLQLF